MDSLVAREDVRHRLWALRASIERYLLLQKAQMASIRARTPESAGYTRDRPSARECSGRVGSARLGCPAIAPRPRRDTLGLELVQRRRLCYLRNHPAGRPAEGP